MTQKETNIQRVLKCPHWC